jgi:hypothetical protein
MSVSVSPRSARDRTPFNSTRPQLNCANWLSDIQSFPGSYDHLSVQLPPDGSFPNPLTRYTMDSGVSSAIMTQDHSTLIKSMVRKGKRRGDIFDRAVTVMVQQWQGAILGRR